MPNEVCSKRIFFLHLHTSIRSSTISEIKGYLLEVFSFPWGSSEKDLICLQTSWNLRSWSVYYLKHFIKCRTFFRLWFDFGPAPKKFSKKVLLYFLVYITGSLWCLFLRRFWKRKYCYYSLTDKNITHMWVGPSPSPNHCFYIDSEA